MQMDEDQNTSPCHSADWVRVSLNISDISLSMAFKFNNVDLIKHIDFHEKYKTISRGLQASKIRHGTT